MQDRNSLCSISSPVRYSYPGIVHTVVNKKSVAIDLKKKLGNHARRISNDSISSNDSGIGLTKEEYEIRRAVRAQRVQRPHIILLHKGKPVYNQNNEDADSNLILKAAIASKRHRREIAVMQQRNSFYSEERDIISYTKPESDPIIVNLNDVSKVDDNSTISVSKDVTQKSEINSDIKPAVSEEYSEDVDINNIVPPEEPIINCTLIESTMNIISEEPKELNEQILKTNEEIPIPRIRSPRRNSIFLNNYSPMKKFSKSMKKLLGIGKEQRRKSIVSFQKIIQKNSLRNFHFDFE